MKKVHKKQTPEIMTTQEKKNQQLQGRWLNLVIHVIYLIQENKVWMT